MSLKKLAPFIAGVTCALAIPALAQVGNSVIIYMTRADVTRMIEEYDRVHVDPIRKRVFGGSFSSAPQLPRCGNGTIESGEQCDDGNTRNNDGCSSICRREFHPLQCGGHRIGESYPSRDGCNTCTCTKTGEICTKRACTPSEQKCVSSNQCPTGQYCTTETGDCLTSCPPGSQFCTQVCAGVCRPRTTFSSSSFGFGGCKVAGCSGQLCVEQHQSGVSTCEWRAEYACYQTARCEQQTNGRCGWTQTAELRQCLGGAQTSSASSRNICPLLFCGPGHVCRDNQCVPASGGKCGNFICEAGEADEYDPGGCGPNADPRCLGEPGRYRQGTCPRDCPRTSSSMSIAGCEPIRCPDGSMHPSCTADGHPINYFADPCQFSRSSSSSSSAVIAGSCEQEKQTFNTAVASNSMCNTDNDCTLFEQSCPYLTCGVGINISAKGYVQSTADAYVACTQRNNEPVACAGCLQQRAACVNGRCTAVNP